MPESKGKKVFRIQLTLSVVVLLLTLSAFSLVAAFYLGMTTGISMQRPPEGSVADTDISADKPLSEEELKFFGLSERKKDQDSFDMEELRDLKKKTTELTKATKTPDSASPKVPKTETPTVKAPDSPASEQKTVVKKSVPVPKTVVPKKPDNVKIPVVKSKKDATYTIQVFASRKHANAKNLLEKLKQNGFKDAFIFKHTAGNKTLYRVRVGKIKRSETNNLANKLKELKFIDSVQVTRF
ncbi:MAG TPA: SPOR domain-containing protein [Candidatus Lambdaproteobacteria bacterium]|jgi:cell division septation protein DedD|uniref:SPOR domain-containing protein n=1 Tax=SAR324 cluster bacterium TaxID=2024889 RepID=A0A432GCV5_9DELT|nr:SPOR domain-containing protein [SAR324 cluster bacterium]MCK5900233.1 SPOR domain-containing protein [bacterium]HIA33720.1 SPOR domain-containing protein [Candidatus Lambdaproteobacteria bacterium]HIP63853.1 SPOR domain-containing protein [Deltaproteobacteria bacterium]MBL4736623.1 SPOR domain-containing protein [SAR324 cluster bacterium]